MGEVESTERKTRELSVKRDLVPYFCSKKVGNKFVLRSPERTKSKLKNFFGQKR